MFFCKSNKKGGFTLAELIVAIAILLTLAVFASSMDFYAMNEKQKTEIENNKIITHYEEIRNNALFGRKISGNIVPEKWKININLNGNIQTFYYHNTWILHKNIHFDNSFQVDELYCSNQSGTNTGSISGTSIDIEINKKNIAMSGCNDSTHNKLYINTSIGASKKEIEINIVNGLIYYM